MQITINPKMRLARSSSCVMISLLVLLTCCSVCSNGEIIGLRRNKPLTDRDVRSFEDFLDMCDIKVIIELLQGNIQLPESWCKLPLINKLCKHRSKASLARKIRKEEDKIPREPIISGLTKIIMACGVDFVVALLQGRITLPSSWCDVPIISQLCRKKITKEPMIIVGDDTEYDDDWSVHPIEVAEAPQMRRYPE